mmetsp:Transcript_41284/g.136811  ORF Transcript_41284/g.136811 Transcript_41284/m.136811 type:complete len:206 (+) Transcript_41284:590-1207(+)
MRPQWLRGDLARDQVGEARVLGARLPEAEGGTSREERHVQPKPEQQQREERGERDGGGCAARPQHEIEGGEGGKDGAGKRKRERADQRIRVRAVDLAVEAGGDVAGRHGGKAEEEEGGGEEPAARRGRDDAEEGEGERDGAGADQLDGGAERAREGERTRRRAEDVCVGVLPSDLDEVVVGVDGVVLLQVPPHRREHDCGDQGGE